MEKIFHNYDVSFHNEIWASAFSGKFASGTTWQWERVFWWPDAVPQPPSDFANNPYQQTPFSTILGVTNILNVGGDSVHVKNRRLHHHFKPLADLLSHPSWTDLGFFNGDYTANKFFDETHTNVIEAYYLKSADSTTAIGWVHNRNAWVMNNFYLRSNEQNFLGCDAPNGETIALTGFALNTEYHITWFPTRLNSTIHPPDTVLVPDGTGTLTLNLTGQFGGIFGNYLDTLRADFAFIITPEPFVKGLFFASDEEALPTEVGWDFTLYPNPARDVLFLRFTDDAPKDIMVMDVAGRQVASQTSVTKSTHLLPLGQLAKGVYWVRVTDGKNVKAKKLIIH